MNILHITNWYPCHGHPFQAPFIVEHKQSLCTYASQELWHIGVEKGKYLLELSSAEIQDKENSVVLRSNIDSSQLFEVFTLILLVFLRFRLFLKRRKWDIVLVHIAYPLLRFPRIVKLLFGKRLAVIEHWSAYHYSFNLPPGSSSIRRMQNTFSADIPVITVSRALANDIQSFAPKLIFPVFIVPNAVDTTIFNTDKRSNSMFDYRILMVANWAPIKQPLLVLKAVKELVVDYPRIKLTIIGQGHQFKSMNEFVLSNRLSKNVRFLGSQPKDTIAHEMKSADLFLHASQYETFSVVCAEALCCGLPVIASRVGAIPELINASNGCLVENTVGHWIAALRDAFLNFGEWNHEQISISAQSQFSRQAVGKLLLTTLESLMSR